MSDFGEGRAWLKQAAADLKAARVDHEGLSECQRRYWFQQCYEKALKAFLVLTFKPADGREEEAFRKVLLTGHSPLYRFDHPDMARFPRIVIVLRRQLITFLKKSLGDSYGTALRIDRTFPRNAPSFTSYRYPFIGRVAGEYVAPCDYGEWDEYQGNRMKVEAALDRLLKEIRSEFSISRYDRNG